MPRLIFPLGHYIGPFYPEKGAPPEHHVVRVGRDTPKLSEEAHLVWGLLHGLSAVTDHMPAWNRDSVRTIATELELPSVEDTIDELLRIGAAVEAELAPKGLVRFATSHRLNGLLHGLGNTADDLDHFGIGLPTMDKPVVRLPIQEYELWQWAPMAPTLWDAYQLLTDVWRHSGTAHPLNTDPLARLDHDLRAHTVHKLLGHGVAYLDRVTG